MISTYIPYSNNCPCGSLYIPIGSKYNPNGLSIRLYYGLEYLDLNLLHNSDSLLSSEQIFVTTTEKISLDQDISIDKIVLLCGLNYSLIVNDSINIVIKDFDSKEILLNKIFGSKNQSFIWDRESVPTKTSLSLENNLPKNKSYNLFNRRLQIEIHSICNPFDASFCCNTNPISFSLENILSNIDLTCCPTTTTTTTTTYIPGACCERGSRWNPQTLKFERYAECLGVMSESDCDPQQGFEAQRIWIPSGECIDCTITDFCSTFGLPNSFNITVIGYGVFANQEANVVITKNGNYYSGSGIFPCGDSFNISMMCDLTTEKFIYDGYVNCCDQTTKWVHDDTPTPLLYPNARVSDIIVGYLKCDSCTQCTSTTTTIAPPLLPCDDQNFGPLTINGYAFYRNSNPIVNISGIGNVDLGFTNNYACSGISLLPRLITNTITLDAQPILISGANINLSTSGNQLVNSGIQPLFTGDVNAQFSFTLPNINSLTNPQTFIMQRIDNSQCNDNPISIVLTAKTNNITTLLFNQPVLPNRSYPLTLCRLCGPSQNSIDILMSGIVSSGSLIPPSSCSPLDVAECNINIPAAYSLPLKIKLSGYVDDDLKVNNQLIEQGLYPYPSSTCNGSHNIGSFGGSGAYFMDINSYSLNLKLVNNFSDLSFAIVKLSLDPYNEQHICLPPTTDCTTTPPPGFIVSGPDTLGSVSTWMPTTWKANIPGATWVWSDPIVQNPTQQETKTFKHRLFYIPSTPLSGTLKIAADDFCYMYINGNQIYSYKTWAIGQTFDVTNYLVSGINYITMNVTNIAGSNSNPAGILYRIDFSW